MSGRQNAGHSHTVQAVTNRLEIWQFADKSGMDLTNRICVHEEMEWFISSGKCRFVPGLLIADIKK